MGENLLNLVTLPLFFQRFVQEIILWWGPNWPYAFFFLCFCEPFFTRYVVSQTKCFLQTNFSLLTYHLFSTYFLSLLSCWHCCSLLFTDLFIYLVSYFCLQIPTFN
jgi:hypothetical protein